MRAIFHLNKDGKAKCGTRKYFISLTNDMTQVNCQRCLNKRSYTLEILPITENYIGKIFHYQFGYDMTLNVYAKVIRQTEKTLIAQECYTCAKDDYGRGEGRAVAGDIKPNGEIYKIILRRKTDRWGTRQYFKGMGRYGCDLWDGKPNYHNSWD